MPLGKLTVLNTKDRQNGSAFSGVRSMLGRTQSSVRTAAPIFTFCPILLTVWKCLNNCTAFFVMMGCERWKPGRELSAIRITRLWFTLVLGCFAGCRNRCCLTLMFVRCLASTVPPIEGEVVKEFSNKRLPRNFVKSARCSVRLFKI